MDWMSNLKITSEEVQGRVPITLLHLQGRINMSNANALEQAVQEAFKQGKRYFLLDLKEVPSVTSAGLRALHTIYKMVSSTSTQAIEGNVKDAASGQASGSPFVKLVNVPPEVQQVLGLAGFDIFLESYATLQEAIAAF